MRIHFKGHARGAYYWLQVGGRKGLGQETHPLFPDDTWLFCKACEESLDIFSRF